MTTPQGNFLHAVLLGDRALVRRLQSRANQDARALTAVPEGAFVVVLGRLSQNRFGPVEIRRFSERVTERVEYDYGVTADEVSRIIHDELGGVATGDDVLPAQSNRGAVGGNRYSCKRTRAHTAQD